MYGFWLPNDPRGSWSEFVRRWELACFGTATRRVKRTDMNELSFAEMEQRAAARKHLKYPPVSISGIQAAGIGRGFESVVAKSNYTLWACAILPEHTHLVIARHTYKVEQIANLLKGSATKQLVYEKTHPLAKLDDNSPVPRMWASRQWKVYLDSEAAIDEAVHYVEKNPLKENKPKQQWKFVTPFQGIPKGGWTTYH